MPQDRRRILTSRPKPTGWWAPPPSPRCRRPTIPPGRAWQILRRLKSPAAGSAGYKLLEKIGEGGFGVVYVAEQKEPVKRRVALKVIKLGMDTRQVVARFEVERQALALMDHANIAKIFDGGATASADLTL